MRVTRRAKAHSSCAFARGATGMYYYHGMTVKAITVDELPKTRRKRVSPIKKTRDWKDVMDRITSGDFEVLEVDFSPALLKLGTSAPIRFKRMLAEEIKRLGIASALHLTFRGITTGDPILYVIRRDKQRNLFLPATAPPQGKTRKSAVEHDTRSEQHSRIAIPRPRGEPRVDAHTTLSAAKGSRATR